MKADFNLDEFTRCLSAVKQAVPNKPNIEAYKGVLLIVEADSARLTASDGEVLVGARVKTEAVREAGEALLPTAVLHRILSVSVGETVSLEHEMGRLRVKVGRAEHFLLCGDPAEYPQVDRDIGGGVEVPVDLLARGIAGTTYATVDHDARYALRGVLFHVTDSELRLVGTDTRRLSQFGIPVSRATVARGEGRDVIPTKALKVLTSALKLSDEETVTYQTNGSAVMFSTDSIAVWARVVEGRFPKYEQMSFPLEHETTLKAGPFASYVRQAEITTDESSQSIKLTPDGDVLKFSSEAGDKRKTTTELRYETGCSVPASDGIRLNPKFVRDALKIGKADTDVVLRYTGSQHPVEIECDGVKALIMSVAQ